nr:MAG TPA: hypothetical protein [Caudoviricetes sp.]
MKLVPKTYQEHRRDYFSEQLSAAKRRLKWAADHNRNWMEIEDDADIVTFYEWAVMMAERECE